MRGQKAHLFYLVVQVSTQVLPSFRVPCKPLLIGELVSKHTPLCLPEPVLFAHVLKILLCDTVRLNARCDECLQCNKSLHTPAWVDKRVWNECSAGKVVCADMNTTLTMHSSLKAGLLIAKATMVRLMFTKPFLEAVQTKST